MSDTNQFVPFFLELCFQILPVITCLGIVVLLVDGTDDIKHGEVPLAFLFVPYGTHLVVCNFATIFGLDTQNAEKNRLADFLVAPKGAKRF